MYYGQNIPNSKIVNNITQQFISVNNYKNKIGAQQVEIPTDENKLQEGKCEIAAKSIESLFPDKPKKEKGKQLFPPYKSGRGM